MGEIKDKILKILKERREINMDDLVRELQEHPGVIELSLKELLKEKKIRIERIYQKHKPVKIIKKIVVV